MLYQFYNQFGIDQALVFKYNGSFGFQVDSCLTMTYGDRLLYEKCTPFVVNPILVD